MTTIVMGLAGLLIGAITGFKLTQAAVAKTSQDKIDEANRTADAAVTEAKAGSIEFRAEKAGI